MKYETDNYELAKQDREEIDRNMVVGKSDLANYLQSIKQGQGHGDKIVVDGVDGEEG